MKNKKSVYIIWLFVMLILYVLFQNTFFGATFLVMVCMGVISIVIAKVLSKAVEIEFESDVKEIRVGGELEFKMIVRNKTLFPTNKMFAKLRIRNYFFEEADVCEVNLPVVIRGEQVITASAVCRYVGNVSVKIKEVIISDYLGLYTYEIPLNKGFDVNVMPYETDINIRCNVRSEDEDDAESDAIDAIEAYDIKEVRDYRDGESLHRIHWNLSARYDDYMIKEYEIETVSRFNIMIDLAKDSVLFINELIEALCGAINVVLTMEREFCVYFYDDKIEAVREFLITDKSDVEQLLDEVYATKFGEKSGEVYCNYTDEVTSDRLDAVYITADRDSVHGEVIGEIKNKVVLMCV